MTVDRSEQRGDWSRPVTTGDNTGVNDQQHAPQPPLPSSTARYGGLEGPDQPHDSPELFPGEKALSRTRAGSREEMRVLRRHYNWVNMVVALVACLVLVLAALALAPRPSGDITREVEYWTVAENAQPAADFDLSVPDLPEGWHSNAASFDHEGTPAVETWYVSLVADDDEGWMSLRQTDAEETPEAWAESYLEEFAETGESDLSGTTFTRFEGVGSSDNALLGHADGTVLLLIGSGDWAQLEAWAEAASQSVGAVAE